MADKNGENGQNIDLDTLSDAQLMAAYTQTMGIPGSLAGRLGLSNVMGSQYGGDRNIYDALGYPRTTDLKFKDFYARYVRQDIAKAVIDKPVNATWRGTLGIREPGEREKLTGFEQAIKQLNENLSLKNWFSRLDKLTGLGHYGVLLLGFDDVQNKETYSKPVKAGERKLIYVKAFGENSVQIQDWEGDASNPRYSQPKMYQLTVTGPKDNSQYQLNVHYSRIIHVTDGALESDIMGQPRLEPIFNRLMDLEKLVGGDAEMFWRGARPGYTGTEKEGFNLTGEQRDKIKDQLKEYEHNLRRFIVTKGMDIDSLEQQISDPASHVDVQIQMIAAEKGIPKRILVGSERGELASSEDRTQWLSEIKTRREEFAEDKIIRPFIKRCQEHKIIPETETGDYMIDWEDLFAPSNQEKAEVGSTRAEALYFYTRQPFATEIIDLRSFLKYGWGLNESEIDDILQSSREEFSQEMGKIAEEGRRQAEEKEKKMNEQK